MPTTTEPRTATFDDFKHWLTRHGFDVNDIAQDPMTLHVGRSDALTYVKCSRFVKDGNGQPQEDRTDRGSLLTESVMVPFDLVPGESAGG